MFEAWAGSKTAWKHQHEPMGSARRVQNARLHAALSDFAMFLSCASMRLRAHVSSSAYGRLCMCLLHYLCIFEATDALGCNCASPGVRNLRDFRDHLPTHVSLSSP